MLEHITIIDLKILSQFTRDYARKISIREITKNLNINYSHAFKRIKMLTKQQILTEEKQGQVNYISLNTKNLDTIQLISFVEEQESQKLKNTDLKLLIQEASQIDPFVCIGVFGSRASGKAKKNSDWDVFMITNEEKKLNRIMSKFPHVKDIQLQVFSLKEFQDSLISTEETVIKHIVRNKIIIFNPYPFYNIINAWERIKYAPTQ